MTPAQTSGTRSRGTNAPRRCANIGFVERPPPTCRSYPSSPPGPATPTNETSLISWFVHPAAHPLIEVLYLRGRFENAGSPTNRSATARTSGVASNTSSAVTPASGQPRITRGVSPQASCVDRPTDSMRSQIAGTSSMRIQCSCTFWRSVTSATSRPKRSLAHAIARSWSAVIAPPSMRMRIMKNSSSSSSGSALPVRSPGTPCVRCVYSPHHRMRLRRSCLPIDRKPPGAKMRSMRSRTLSPSSSFLICSAGFRGSWYPMPHCPSPRGRGVRGAGVEMSVIGIVRCCRSGEREGPPMAAARAVRW